MADSEGVHSFIAVSVRRISGAPVGIFDLLPSQTVSALKQAIQDAGGPPLFDQQLISGHVVLKDAGTLGEVLGASTTANIFLVTVEGCPTCKGPCACTLCGCNPEPGLIDYYGVCRNCGKCGGHGSQCPFCRLRFPSLCALDTHVKFTHADMAVSEWNLARFDTNLEQRKSDQDFLMPQPEPGTFGEERCGGLQPRQWFPRYGLGFP
mmetsp:Transcript_116172/g.339779  ORF Transcript_116172/g.339779 Transcript_116172/m.339779 type:complete len:207 (-) Transcript_116172:123-743(-)